MSVRALPQKPGAACGESAFTLVEIMVSIAILGLIVVLVAQIFNGSSLVILQNNKLMSALDAAQGAFQQMDVDISNMVLRDDVDYSFVKVASTTTPPGNDSLSFYANTSGFTSSGAPASGNPRPLSVVAYKVVQNTNTNLLELDYGAQQMDWNNSGSNPLVFTSATQLLTTPNTLPTVSGFTTLAPEVIRMEICFQLINDPISTDSPAKLITSVVPTQSSSVLNGAAPIRNVAGIFVGLVVIDSKTRLIVPNGVDLKVAKLFPDSGSGTVGDNEDILSLWTPISNKVSTLEGAGLSAQAVGGVHVYQAYFPLSH